MSAGIIARGLLEVLWESCYESGDDYVGTAADVENLVGWTGEAGALALALVEAGAPEGFGFIEPVAEGATTYRVHDLWHHAPDYVSKRRKRELERQDKVAPERLLRADRRTAPNGADLFQTQTCLIEVDGTPAPAPAPAPQKKIVSTETSSVPAQPALLEFPVVGPGPGTWPLTADKVAEWAALFPTLDVLAECRAALAWVRENPRNRKTASGMGRFLVAWFTRSVNRGGARLVGRQDGPHDQRPRGCRHQPACRDAAACTAKQAAERRAIPA